MGEGEGMTEREYTVKVSDDLFNCWIYDKNESLVGNTLKEDFLRFIRGPQFYQEGGIDDGNKVKRIEIIKL